MKSKKSKSKTFNSFEFRLNDEVVSVWLGSPDDIESEFVLRVHKYYLPELISILRKSYYS